MKIEQIYTGCLAHGAYYLESNGEAVIVDPLREVTPYLERASQSGAKIKYVLETHFHADFVSGHLDLAKATGAQIVYGPTAKPAFPAHVAKDGERLKVGDVEIQVLHTPGHTMESSCFLVRDEKGVDRAIFTGDTLFIGDVGRPDLAQKSGLTLNDLAGHLYESLRTKIIPLSDDLIVYPGHGAGSACGKKMSSETVDTLGHQKRTNYALREMTKDQFITEVTDGLAPPPGYFPLNVKMNREGYESFDEVRARGMVKLSPAAFEAAVEEAHAIILDTRPAQVFAKGFIPNSINIGIDGTFAPWVGTLIADINQPFVLVADEDKVQEVITRMARVGYDFALGYLDGGVNAWTKAGKPLDSIRSISPEELYVELEREPIASLLDVRKASEYNTEHVAGSENLPLDYLNKNMAQIDKNKKYYVTCAGGYRSMIFVSILRARGYENLVDVRGGFKAIKDSKLFLLTDIKEQNTEL